MISIKWMNLGLSWLRNPFFLGFLLFLFFLLQGLLRYTIQVSLEWDQSEQAFLSQFLKMGYGIQPPLYNWLGYFSTQIVGSSVLALYTVKTLVLMSTYGIVYFTAKEVSGQHYAGALSISFLVLFPQYSYESFRDLSHTVLATFFCATSLFLTLILMRRPTVWKSIALGACIGSAFLSKYNSLLVMSALFCAVLLDPRGRALIKSRYFVWIVLSSVLIALPHLVWLCQHIESIFSQTLNKVGQGEGHWFQPIVAYAVGLMGFVGVCLITLIMTLGFCRSKQVSMHTFTMFYQKKASHRFLIHFIAVMSCIVLLVVLFGSIADVKDRYYQMFYSALPILLGVFFASNRNERVSLSIVITGFVVMSFSLMLVLMTVYGGEWIGKNIRTNKPYPELVQVLKGYDTPFVLAANSRIAGNIVAHWPEADIHAVGYAQFYRDQASELNSLIVVWEPSSVEVNAMPYALKKELEDKGFAHCKSIQNFSHPYYHSNVMHEWRYCHAVRAIH